MLSVNNLLKLGRFAYLYQQPYVRLATLLSTKLNSSMKKFIDSKQYRNALDLFEQQSQHRTDISVTMALKACIELRDYQCGMNIAKQLSIQSLQNKFIQTLLIQFYMKCHDVDNANRIFSTIVNKSNFTYTFMFKGYISNNMPEKVLDLLDEMTIRSDKFTLSIAFKACAEVNDKRARRIGNQLLDQMTDDFQNDTVLTNSTISMLMKFGDIERAEYFFGLIRKKDVISYGAMIKGYVENNMIDQALNLFEQMTVTPDNVIYIIIFDACAQLKTERAINVGKKLLHQMSNKTAADQNLLASTINMLMSFGDVKGAEHLFESIQKKNTFIYGGMMRSYVGNGMNEKALDLFEQMPLIPDDNIYPAVFKASAKLNNERAMNIGRKLIDEILNKLEIANAVLNSAISMLMKYGDVARAEHLFQSIKKKDVISYGAMVKGYVENNMIDQALNLFEQITVTPDDVIYIIVFDACAQLKNERAINMGNKLLDQMPCKRTVNQTLLTSIIHMLMSFGDVKRAEHLFESMKKKNSITYTVMMKGYADNEMFEEVLDLFERMCVNPISTMYTVIFTTCAKLKNERAIKIGKKLADEILNKPEIDKIVLNSATHMLMKFGDVKGAEHLFGLINKKDIISYAVLLQGYIENEMSEKALNLFEQMSLNPDNSIYSIIFNACAQLVTERAIKLGNKLLEIWNKSDVNNNVALTPALHMLMRFDDAKRAEQLFESVKNKDLSTYVSMMKAHNLNGEPLKCLQLFQMLKQQDIVPDEAMFILPIHACSQLGMLAVCQSFVAQIPSHLYGKQRVSNALIDMWGKAGSVKNAQEIFTTINNPHIFIYNSMINTFGLNGKGPEAIDLFRQISHNIRNEVSYICVINACSHSGLLNEAHTIFNQANMKTKRITTTMIDCVSRLHLFDEAQRLLCDYEQSNPPYLPMYMAILSGARNSRDSNISEKIYNKMKVLFPDQKNYLISGSILLANIYSSLGDYDQATVIRSNRRRNYGNKVKPGLSWTEKDGEILQFAAHDHSHPLSNEIHGEAKRIAHELNEYGHRFDPSWITRPLAEDESIESVLCSHSERLAIAFHFIRGRHPSFVQITKNLRVCGDCHQATKLIAKIRQCDIVLRDANRIHHFSKNGNCSCQDHF